MGKILMRFYNSKEAMAIPLSLSLYFFLERSKIFISITLIYQET